MNIFLYDIYIEFTKIFYIFIIVYDIVTIIQKFIMENFVYSIEIFIIKFQLL